MKTKKPQPFLIKNLKWISLFMAIICILFVYFIPRAIQYSDYWIVRFTPVIFIFIFIPILELIALTLFTQRFKLSIGLVVLSIGIIGPTFGLYQDHREKIELDKYGVWTKAVVVDKKLMYQKGGGSKNWGIKCKYKVGGHIYETLYYNDLSNIHPIGDTIRLIYSSRFPKINTPEFEWNK